MNWDALFEMLKGLFANDPTMLLLLTLGFFFLKQIWPQPQAPSEQVLTGFVGRIRKALELGDRDRARQLADEGIAKTAEYLATEAEPHPKGILDIFTGIFGNSTLMPLLLIGGLFLMLMITNGGGCKKASASAVPAPVGSASITWEKSADVSIHPSSLDALAGPADLIRLVGYEPGLYEPWSWTGPAESGLSVDCGGNPFADAGAGGGAARCDAASLAGGAWAPVADCGSGSDGCRGASAQRARAVPRLALRRAQPFRNVARVLARPFRWLRLPVRAVARLRGSTC